MNSPKTILIGHSSTLLCEILKEALEHRNYRVLSFTNSGVELEKKRRLLQPDILITCNLLEGLSGIEVIEGMQKSFCSPKCLFMSNEPNEVQAVYQRLNVEAHVPSFVNMSEFFYALQEVSEGRKYISPKIEKMFYQIPAHKIVSVIDSALLQVLTPREIEIMQALANSFTTPQIASRLFISTATVNNHRANIMQKLSIKGRNQLMGIAIALKPYYAIAA
jgi:two-component system response regulator NreC